MLQPIFYRTATLVAVLSAYALFLSAQVPSVPAEAPGLPPRASAADYQSQAKTGRISVGAEFDGHSIDTVEGPLTNEDYVSVEIGLFGPAGTRLTLSPQDFSLRVNGKKTLPSQPYALVLKGLKDPEWIAPDPPKSKTTALGNATDPDPEPVAKPKPSFQLMRAWSKRAEKAALAEGDRPLPQAGVLFFEVGGKPRSVELIYNGPAGKFTMPVQP